MGVGVVCMFFIVPCQGTADLKMPEAKSGTVHQMVKFMFKIVHGP